MVVAAVALGASVYWLRAEEAQPHCACEDHPPVTAVPATALDGASVYQIEGDFIDQDDHPFLLTSLRGEPVLVAMFYASCTTVCPRIISEMSRIEQAIPETERSRLRLVLVTIDPQHDTTTRLRELAVERALETPRWTLLRADEDTVHELAMALGVQYRRVGEGEFVHSALITLLDGQGRITAQLDGIDSPIEPIVARTHELLAGHEDHEE